jgi:hypothetical protein
LKEKRCQRKDARYEWHSIKGREKESEKTMVGACVKFWSTGSRCRCREFFRVALCLACFEGMRLDFGKTNKAKGVLWQ